MNEELTIALCFALAHNSTLLPMEQQHRCGILQTDLTCTSMSENPVIVNKIHVMSPVVMDAWSSRITQSLSKSVKFIQLSKQCSPVVLLLSMHHGKKSMKGLKKTCINSTAWKNNIQNSGQILNDRVHAG